MMQDKTVVGVLEAVDQYLYCIFVYFMALALMKPLVWPTLRFDTYVYFITTIPAALNAVIRFTFIFIKVSFNDESTISIVTSVMSSFLIYLVALTFVIISTVTNSRCGVTLCVHSLAPCQDIVLVVCLETG